MISRSCKLITIISLVFILVLSACSNNSGKNDNKSTEVNSESFPEKTIKFIIPYGPGGDTDTIGRELARSLEEELGVSVVVQNIEGAGGTVALDELEGSENDGYTVLFHHSSMILLNVLGLTDISYNDLDSLGIVADDPTNGLYSSSNAKYNSLEELISYGKDNNSELKVASALGNFTHMLALAFEDRADIDLNVVDVGGGQDQVLSVSSGRTDLFIGGSMLANPYVESGDLQPLGVFSEERVESIPDIPTFKEQGLDLVFPKKYFMFTPKDTPEEVKNVYEEALEKITEDKEFKENIASTFAIPDYFDSQDSEELFEEYKETYENYKDELIQEQ